MIRKLDLCFHVHSTPPGGLNISGDNAYANEIQYFINCILDNKAPDFVSPESSACSIELAKTILKKAEIIG